MKVAYILVIALMSLAFVGTIALGGKGEEKYEASAKQNTIRLTLFYVALGIVLFLGLSFYLIF